MIKRSLPTIGDYVGFIFGQPGNDTTYAQVLRESDGRLVCYDPWFHLEFDAVAIGQPGLGGCWLLLEPEAAIIEDDTGQKNVMQRVSERRTSGEFETRRKLT